ncbi:SpaA isopeptide-forming pilin-related protein, partial [Enterococcus casseliflavus]|nr:SpaA isopeptide-forming pilin-related protein [Enterococcus casseliflavus]
MKTDSEGNPLSGAEFKVVDNKGETIQEGLVSDERGIVSVIELAPGDYQFIETKAPEGYVLNTTPVAFIIEDSAKGQPKVVVASEGFVNYKGSAQLVKTDSEGNPLSGAEFKVVDNKGETIQEDLVSDEKGIVSITELAPGDYQFIETKAPEGYVLNATPIVFTIETSTAGKPAVVAVSEDYINYKGSAQLVKTDSEGNPLSGAEFEVVDKGGKIIQEGLISDEKGIVSIAELAPGDYQFIETKAPESYILNTTPVVFTIEDSAKGQPKVVVASEGFINYKGSAQLVKTDSEGNPLFGAEFKVVDNKGETIQEGLVSDEKGIVSITELAPGDYQFNEIKAPEGYVLNTTPVAFTIEDSAKGQPKVVVASEGFVNYKGSAQLVKTDSEDNALFGAEFKVVDNKGETIQEGLVSDEKGIVSITELTPGDYQFIETKAPEGYIINPTPIDFTIKYSTEGQPEVVIASEGFVNYQGSAQLVKTDSEGNPLSGAEFKVVDTKGEAVKEGIISNADGIVSATGLASGDYQFIETKAPEGFILNSTVVNFTIKAEAADEPEVVVASESFVNYQGSAQLLKTDSKENPLPGAKFKIIDKEGKTVIQDLVSDDKGFVSITNLAPGDYQFIETKAPRGYVLDETPVEFTIVSEALGEPSLVDVGEFENKAISTIENSEKGSSHDKKLPKTNDQDLVWMEILGVIILILIGIIIYF